MSYIQEAAKEKQMSGLKTFKMLHKQFCENTEGNYAEVGEMVLYVLYEAHQMMRDGKITKEALAECMDEAVCW